MKNLKHLFLVSILFIPFIVNAEECATNNAIYLDCPTLKPGQTIECKVMGDINGDLLENKEYEGDTIAGVQFKLVPGENMEITELKKHLSFYYGSIDKNNDGSYDFSNGAENSSEYSKTPTIGTVKIKVSDKAKEGDIIRYSIVGADTDSNDENIILSYIDGERGESEPISNYAKDVCGSLTVGKADNNNNNSGNTTPAKDNKKPTNPSTGITTSFIIVGVTGLIIAGSYIVTKKNKENFY